jgi:SGNH hydrolase-like domain, acetyltransferase AlgX
MNRLRNPQWLLILMFLGIIAGVPLIQMLIEAREEDGVRAFDVFSQVPTAANLRAYERSMEAANWAARVSRPWIQFAQFAWLKDGGEKCVIGCAGWYFYKPGLNYMLVRRESAKAASTTNDPIAAIVDFRDQLAAQGIRLVVMPVPNKESIYPDRLTSRAEPGRGVLGPRTHDLLDTLRAANVEVIDLFKEFGEAREQTGSDFKSSLYLAQDTHWSPAGVDLAAKAVARRLVELGWVQPGQDDYNERSAPVQRLGDILRMLRVPLIERRVNPETVSSVQVIRHDSGELYKDAPDAEILVLGDSFVRIYQQDEPGAAGFIAHLAKELKQPLISLVNDGGGSTLVREELRGRPAFLKNKKVVLWEFVERDIGLGLGGWKLVRLPATGLPSSPDPVKAQGFGGGSRIPPTK